MKINYRYPPVSQQKYQPLDRSKPNTLHSLLTMVMSTCDVNYIKSSPSKSLMSDNTLPW